MKFKILLVCLFTYFCSQAQTSVPVVLDSVKQFELNEIVITTPNKFFSKTEKPLGSIDEYLEQGSNISMIKRGAYASEPLVNGMSSERSVITIDGMRIYGACTDKMDPVTSYVEISNLHKASISSGATNAEAATIAGSLNLIRKKSLFEKKAINGSAFTGFETNNKQRIFGANLSYSTSKFFVDLDATYRKADNYKAGGDQEILYSQFKKVNTSAIIGYKISKHKQLEASVIYDHATNIGYAALPMDVLFAKAFMGSVAYKQHHLSNVFYEWETKWYYNKVTHVMDDSKRPNVPIRMDMPGWSKTTGFYSTLKGAKNKHTFKFNINGHHNFSLAEMTMFSNIPSQKDMFMLTWPGVVTNYVDFNLEEKYLISNRFSIQANAGIALHNNQLNNEFGYESLQIFYPDLKKSNHRLLKRFSVSAQFKPKNWYLDLAAGYSERAPSISEAYGFYLFNSFDKYDYMGNPNLKAEKATSLTANVQYKKTRWSTQLSGSVFYITNYIIGKPQANLSVMTIGATGVKTYSELAYASIYNASLDLNYKFFDFLELKNQVFYARGVGQNRINLPTMQPFSFQSSFVYSKSKIGAILGVKGAAKQNNINELLGEQPLPGYLIFNASASKVFYFSDNQLIIKLGAENIFDKKYTTFANWNRLPQMGRNIFINTSISF